MSDTKKLAAFLRTAIREGVVYGVDHPFTEAAKHFYANVDVLNVCTAEQWFASNKDQADLVDRVYEAYNQADTISTEPVQPIAADNAVSELEKLVSELEKLQTRVKALEDAKEQPAPEEQPSEETTAPEA